MAASIGTAWIQIKPSMKGIGKDISKELNGAVGKATKSSEASLAGIGAGLKKAFFVGSTAAVAFAGVAVKAFADYEQLVGGVAKIFDQADQARILKDAQNAYKDLNISASQYLTAINQVGAAFASTMGDQKGYDIARKGMKAISDFASGTGRNIDELNQKYQLITRSTSSYQSIADQFSGILPATSKDFLKQAQSADLLSKKYKKLTDVPIAEYQEVVTKMLEKGTAAMGLAGNTAAESANTISGSFNATKSAISNVFAALGTGDAELVKTAMNNLAESAGNLVRNVLAILPNIFKALADGLKEVTKDVPVLGGLISGIVSFIEFIVKNADFFLPLAAGIGAVVAAIWLWNTATNALKVSQLLLNAVLAANPIGIIVLAIIGLITMIGLLWTTNENFRDNVIKAWDKIKGAFMGAFNWVKKNWPLILAILTGPIGLAVLAIIKNFDKIKSTAKSIVTAVTNIFKGIGTGISDAFKTAVNFLVDNINTLINSVNSVTSKVGISSIPNIPRLAEGGIVSQPTLAIIGEGRESEAVIPLSKLDAMLSNQGGGSQPIYNITVNGVFATSDQEKRRVADQIVRAINQNNGVFA